MSRIPQAVMRQVQQVLDSRRALPKAQLDSRPKLQTTGFQARDEDGGGTYTELLIYDEISYFGVMAADVADALTGVTGDLHVRINSPGGDVFDGVAIYNMLADHNGHVRVTVDGLAASAASFIAMAGDEIEMKRAAQMMIHDAIGVCIGNAADMNETAGLLERVSDIIASIYADRTGGTVKAWRTQMRAETWYAAQEAVDAGLATKLAPKPARGADVAAAFDLSIFRYPGRDNAPAPAAVLDVAMPVHHTATENTAWDGPAAEAAMPNEAAVLKATHAWRDADGDPDAKSSYKFPHHRHEGSPANLAACRNGLARLSGANIPDGDRAGVEAHLRAHLNDAGDEDDNGGAGDRAGDVTPADQVEAELSTEWDPSIFASAVQDASLAGFTYDPEMFRLPMQHLTDNAPAVLPTPPPAPAPEPAPPPEPEPQAEIDPGFVFDPDAFRLTLQHIANNAPAAPAPAPDPEPDHDPTLDATIFTRAIREATR